MSVREATLPTIPEKNNIGALRLVFAALVVCAHSYALSLNPALEWLGTHANSTLAVQGFFVLSGFLVVMSYEKARGLRDYFAKRVRRIYPAYLTVILLCAIAGMLITTLSAQQYFSGEWLHYVISNLLFVNFHQPNLPGVFEDNPLQAVNGALWTIKIEVMFYAVVPILVWLFRSRYRLAWMAAIYVAAQFYAWSCTHLAATTGHAFYIELGRQLPGQLAFFISGAALYYYHGWMMQHRRWLVPVALVVYVSTRLTGIEFFFPAALAILVMAIAFAPYLGNSERYGDVSYGLYIWHFPILQLLVSLALFASHPFLALAAAFAAALAMAGLSWHLVEKRFLRKTSHYRVVT